MRKSILTAVATACLMFVGGCSVGLGGNRAPEATQSSSAAAQAAEASQTAGGLGPASPSPRGVRSGGPFCEGYDALPKAADWQAMLNRADKDELRRNFRDLLPNQVNAWKLQAPTDISQDAWDYVAVLYLLHDALETATWDVARLEPAMLNSLKDAKFQNASSQIAGWITKHCGPPV